MSLKVKSINQGSLAEEYGIEVNDTIVSINGIEIRDFLDLELYASDYRLKFVLEDEALNRRELTIYRESAKSLGIIPEEYKHKHCQNNCIFCFIDQMPPQMRQTLYVKDDDYLFSYVFGNYITLTNLSQDEIERIVDQRISPLYISLHSSNPELRQKMMRSRHAVDAMAIIRYLADREINFHIQIVLVPGYNDRGELDRTITDLMDQSLNILSIGIVPVGLTANRNGLSPLQPFDKAMASKVLDQIMELRERFDSDIIYPADEFFVLAEREIPKDEFYQDYPQLENGIGMLSLSSKNFKTHKRALLKELRGIGGDFLILGSKSAFGQLDGFARDLNRRLKEQKISVQTVYNRFFGEHINVAGLITFSDITSQVKYPVQETLIIPDVIFNNDGLTLDGHDLDELRQCFNRQILLVDQFWEDWVLVE
nr:hypothetical protein [Candidatus Cloacimonadota bacterium]